MHGKYNKIKKINLTFFFVSGCVSNPPPYDTLSTHSRVSASDPPPEYASVANPASTASPASPASPTNVASIASPESAANVANFVSPASAPSVASPVNVANNGEEVQHD